MLYIILVVINVVFVIKSFLFLDPDFGWHLRMGEIISTTGVPATDQFSYTMPSFPHVDHEWLTDFILYNLYTRTNMLVLAFIYSVMALASVYLSLGPIQKKYSHFHYGFLVLGSTVLMPYLGVRHQVISWLFLAILARSLFSSALWKKVRYLTPFLFVLWANVHGGFVAGLALLWFYLLFDFVQGKSKKSDLLIAILASLGTFITPYGPALWREVASSMFDSSLRWTISEWMPSFLLFDISMLWLIALSLTLVGISKAKGELKEITIYAVFLLQGLMSRRNIPLWAIVSMPIMKKYSTQFFKKMEEDPISKKRVRLVGKVFLGIVLAIFVFQSTLNFYGAKRLSEDRFYPKAALQFLDANYPDKRLFSDYGWGGYILWKSPKRKLFIDGRMPSWKWEANIQGETNNAMKDYMGIFEGNVSYKDIFPKYGVEAVMLHAQSESESKSKTLEQLENIFNSLLSFFGKNPNTFNLLEELRKDGWSEVYKDDTAVVFIKE